LVVNPYINKENKIMTAEYKSWTDTFPSDLPPHLLITFEGDWADECTFFGFRIYTREQFLKEKRLLDLAITSYGLYTECRLYFGTNQDQEECLVSWLEGYKIYDLDKSKYLDGQFLIDILCRKDKTYGDYKSMYDLLREFEELFETENL